MSLSYKTSNIAIDEYILLNKIMKDYYDNHIEKLESSHTAEVAELKKSQLNLVEKYQTIINVYHNKMLEVAMLCNDIVNDNNKSNETHNLCQDIIDILSPNTTEIKN
jgi:hypothetical protein